MDLRVVANTAKAASKMLPVCLTAKHALFASCIPEIWSLGLVVKHAAVCWRDCAGWAMHRAIVWILSAKTTLHVHAVSIATDLAHCAIAIPIIWQVRWILERAPGCWTINF